MNLISIFQALRKRWWVAGLVLLITAAGVYWVVSNARDQYQAAATLLLAGPELVGGDGGNIGESDSSQEAEVRLDSSVVLEIAEGDEVRARLGSVGEGIDYSITPVAEEILRVEAVSGSEDAVVEMANAVIDEIRRVTEELDGSDTQRTGEVTILSEPRSVRERTILGSEGADQTEYFAEGSVLLAIEETFDDSADVSTANPFAPSIGALRLIQEVSSTAAAREQVLATVGDEQASFEVVFETRDPIPLMFVTASASTPQTTMATLEATLLFLDGALADRQALTGADESTWLQFQRIAVPETAEPMGVRLGRPIATVLVLGVVAAVSLALLVDSMMSYRSGQPVSRPSDESTTSESAIAGSKRSRAS